jgi:hypothetical protein
MEAAIIGAPVDLGAGRRGVDMGPSAIRYAGLEERLVALGVGCIDCGNVAAAVAEAIAELDPRRFLPAIRATCERIAGPVGAALDGGRVPIVLAGDHSIALGTLAGLASRRGAGAVRCCGLTPMPTSIRRRRPSAATSTVRRWRPPWDATGRASRVRRGRCRRYSRSGLP